MNNNFTEVLLHFEYGGENKVECASILCELLEKNKIDYVGYIENGYWNPSFYIRKCGKKWNDIMEIVNSVKAPVYKKVKESFYISDNLTSGKGNIQRVIYC